jgi:hypothetical protein
MLKKKKNNKNRACGRSVFSVSTKGRCIQYIPLEYTRTR